MESIVKFSFPSVTYKCSLNRKGRRKYGTLQELLNTGYGTQSTVGLPDGTNVENLEIRRSLKYQTITEFDIDPTVINNELSKLLTDNIPKWDKMLKYDVIEYLVGGFFREHQDKKVKENHFATLLIFPPATNEFAHTGGELILDMGRFRFDSSSNREWAFIAFHTELPHECTEILSGKRIVFKTELFSTRPVNRDTNGHPDMANMVMDRGIEFLQFPPTPRYVD